MPDESDWKAISELKYEYCYRMDARDADGFVSLFTEDAEFDITTVAEGRGRDELRAFIETLQGWDIDFLAHMVSNPLIDIEGDEATGTWYYVVFIGHRSEPTEFGHGRYDETYRRVDGEWLIDSLDATRRYTGEL